MASILKVDQIKNTGASGDIDIPTGYKIKGADTGSIVAPGNVIQVAHHKWSSAATTTSTSLSDVSGSSFTFTAKQANSKLYILTDVSITQTRTAAGSFGHYELNVDGSVIQGSGDTYELGMSVGNSTSVNLYQRASKSYFINASNTSAKTIKLQFAVDSNANSGQTRINVNSQFYSAITVMEVAQ